MSSPVLIISRKDLAGFMKREDYLHAVEEAFRAGKEGRANSPLPMHIDGVGGVFHAKGASYKRDKIFVALKLNGNFPENPACFGLPTIQGAVLLCDGERGSLLAILDSIEITLRRTAAASALAAKHLARPDAQSLLVCGCGEQGRAQIEALCDVITFRQIYAWDIDREKARAFAGETGCSLGVKVNAVGALSHAARKSDVIVTCTTASEAFLTPDLVAPGTFVAAVGADSPYKNEIAPELMAASKVVADVRAQSAEIGDVRAAVAAGAMSAEDVYADLGEIVTGEKAGRQSPDEIIVFDSTGTALQDVVSAVVAFDRAQHDPAPFSVALGEL